jgi:hypothetical protein
MTSKENESREDKTPEAQIPKVNHDCLMKKDACHMIFNSGASA